MQAGVSAGQQTVAAPAQPQQVCMPSMQYHGHCSWLPEALGIEVELQAQGMWQKAGSLTVMCHHFEVSMQQSNGTGFAPFWPTAFCCRNVQCICPAAVPQLTNTLAHSRIHMSHVKPKALRA
jgi:hypothetical protein